jgi:cobalt-zinc-cadmium efflux system protein
MFTHFLSLCVALGAMVIAAIPRDVQKTFGLFRAEVLAALLNGLGLIPLALFILYESYQRMLDPSSVSVAAMLPIAGIGLASNLVTAFLLFKVQRHDLNLKGAIMHMFADTISSVAVIVVGVILLFTDLYVLDALVSLGIAVLILIWSGGLVRDTLRVLLEIAPRDFDVEKVRRSARCIKGVKDLHDIHAWEITTGMVCMTAHVDVDAGKVRVERYPQLIQELRAMMLERYGVVHTVFELCPT